ncbi:glycosyltransferase [Spirosoma rhododendri]|uniref:Glycosyltransferase n=1 Tax=Spirosoma rhododendri TaxID=2728024 RepID=A0A7L5DX54_9BACT|nr:glycosyltransferase [Spirosoma rhododendri]QJD80120.1 glycosyltransferase [Spirosoma rhododendri]
MASPKKNLLIIGSSQGVYGGIEAYMIALAEAASAWPEYEVKLCFKIVQGMETVDNLINSARAACPDVHFVRRGSRQLLSLIRWADVLHVQNMPPDIVFPARLLGKKIFLTVHNRRLPESNLHNLIWRFSIQTADQRWYNSNFVWNTWEQDNKAANSSCVPTVCRLPTGWCPPADRKGFLFVGRWIGNKGIEELLKAYAQNQFNPDEWPLTILGDGPLKPTVLGLIDELKLTGVRMPGFVNDNQKEQYMASSRWLLAPARTQEDLGLTPSKPAAWAYRPLSPATGGYPKPVDRKP